MTHVTQCERFYRKFIVAMMISFLNSGCTIMGTLIGLSNDSQEPTRFSMNDSIGISQGTLVEVVSFQEYTVRGIYQGLVTIQPPSCRENFEHARRSFPDILRDSITVSISLSNGKAWQGTISGFEPGIIKFVRSGMKYTSSIPIEYIESATSGNGILVPGDSLRCWMEQGLIPSHSALMIACDSSCVALPLLSQKSIQEIKLKTYYNTLILGLIGLCIDVIIINEISRSPLLGPIDIHLR
jgi:hypothetical protein